MGSTPREDGTGVKTLPEATARSLIRPVAEPGMRRWKDSGKAPERGGNLPPTSNTMSNEAAKARVKIRDGRKRARVQLQWAKPENWNLGQKKKKKSQLPHPCCYAIAHFQQYNPTGVGGMQEGATRTRRDRCGSIPHQTSQFQAAAGARPARGCAGHGLSKAELWEKIRKTTENAQRTAWVSATNRLKQALSKEIQ